MNVLIAHESLTVRMELVRGFARIGAHAEPCRSPEEARDLARQGTFDLAIVSAGYADTGLADDLRGLAVPVLLAETPVDIAEMVAQARETCIASGRPITVLLVDDSPTFREELARVLTGHGFRVIAATTGEEGLKIATARRPPAIVVDGQLPGIDGATVIRRLRLDPDLRDTLCVLLTGADDPNAELNALDAGADAFVRKEEDPSLMLAKLSAVLRRARSTLGALAAPEAVRRRILAVDDSPTYLNELHSMLSNDGYEIVLAPSGEIALEQLASGAFDCILLDLMMPGMDGQEVCHRIKSSPIAREIPLIMLTALDERDAMITALGAGADDYLAKSPDFDVLRARVRAQIRRRQSETENRRIREELLRRDAEATEARAAHALAEARASLADELTRRNKELEAFSYSVSHDLRAPLRSIDGFSQAFLEDYGHTLDERGRGYLERVRSSAQRMGELIDDLLQLSRVSRVDMVRRGTDLTRLANAVVAELGARNRARSFTFQCEPDALAHADPGLVRVVLENLLDNAFKFTANKPDARIEFGRSVDDATPAFFVRDNGAGFDMQYVQKLFAPFQRLHSESDFPGTGIGLATVARVVERHGGRAWAQSVPGIGTTIYFTLSAPPGRSQT